MSLTFFQRDHGEAVAPDVRASRGEPAVRGQGGGREGEEEEDKQVRGKILTTGFHKNKGNH